MMKRAAVAAVVAALLLVGGPAQASDDASRPKCTITRVGSTDLITGRAVAQGPAIDTSLVCHIYYNGAHVASVGGVGAGPVAVVARALGGLPPFGQVTVCAEAHFRYLDGSSESFSC